MFKAEKNPDNGMSEYQKDGTDRHIAFTASLHRSGTGHKDTLNVLHGFL